MSEDKLVVPEKVKKPVQYIPWLVGGVIATVATLGIYRLVRLAITVALVIYAFRLSISLGSPSNSVVSFLQDKYYTIVRLFIVLVALYFIYGKKNSKKGVKG